uniref:Uncharacterized protein n=1 Tax=Chromera velia CCMP2878 TaxID=1169474 RepID=A0A0G4GE37_9ALVE|eukprot:Cvel_21487.t1-p1 / transcript=Cvel_21487.t1 / gene=Cvel_21487 / organism=Chromera_velia_CCMP2878 / gene_product=hypothetical protein / transcript_product=hypothetical protein / location=Cvel_scaffold2018:32571-33185(+) / protein_length=205 / sequence_SO=supercontig / SO=protein_coding / is_pseudo=false
MTRQADYHTPDSSEPEWVIHSSSAASVPHLYDRALTLATFEHPLRLRSCSVSLLHLSTMRSLITFLLLAGSCKGFLVPLRRLRSSARTATNLMQPTAVVNVQQDVAASPSVEQSSQSVLTEGRLGRNFDTSSLFLADEDDVGVTPRSTSGLKFDVPSEETTDANEAKSWAIMGVLMVGAFVVPWLQLQWYTADDADDFEVKRREN